MKIRFDDFNRLLESDSSLNRGCIVDTNILFASSFPLDPYNEWAESLSGFFKQRNVPVFTNMNVRSEFIELNRRVLIPEGLVDFYNDSADSLNGLLTAKLKSLKTRKDKAAVEGRTFKLSDSEIKEFRRLFSAVEYSTGVTLWDAFCRDYFYPYIGPSWDNAVSLLKIRFLGTREIESQEYFDSRPNWADMIEIVGRSGIGASDAMIINLFLKSNIPVLVTTDRDVSDTVTSLLLEKGSNRYVLVPN